MSIYRIKKRFRGFLPVVVDVETAGFNPQTDALLEIACQTVEMDAFGYFTPGKLLSAELQPFAGAVVNEANLEFLGIKLDDPKRAAFNEQEAIPPIFREIQHAVKRYHCKRAVLVGQNAHFDLGFLNALASRIGSPKSPFHPFTVCDLATLSLVMLGHSVLATSCRRFNIDFDDKVAHHASYDTTKECELFCALLNRYQLFNGFPDFSDTDESEDTAPSENHDEDQENADETSSEIQPEQTLILPH